MAIPLNDEQRQTLTREVQVMTILLQSNEPDWERVEHQLVRTAEACDAARHLMQRLSEKRTDPAPPDLSLTGIDGGSGHLGSAATSC